MAATNFSGPVVSTGGFTGDLTGDVIGGTVTPVTFTLPTDTAANIADATADINADGSKTTGTMVFDTTNNLLYVALGAAATDDWALIDGVGSTAVTPS